MTAFDTAVHCDVTRWPAPAVEQAWQDGSAELGLVAKYLIELIVEQTHAEWSLLWTVRESVQAVQPEVVPVPSSEYVLAVAQAVQVPED